jgi:hypothetical protein
MIVRNVNEFLLPFFGALVCVCVCVCVCDTLMWAVCEKDEVVIRNVINYFRTEEENMKETKTNNVILQDECIR